MLFFPIILTISFGSEQKFISVPDFNILEFQKPVEEEAMSVHLVWLLTLVRMQIHVLGV